MSYGGVRFYPIQVAEKGFVVYKIRVKGRWGHGSVPTPDNAAVLAARIVTRLADQGVARVTAPLAASLADAVPHLGPRAIGALDALMLDAMTASRNPGSPRQTGGRPGNREVCDPVLPLTISAMVHDTISVGIVRAGVKYNVIPGTAEIEIDCRTLPGTDEPAMLEELRRRIGKELWERIEVECEQTGPAVSAPLDCPLYRILEEVVAAHDPKGVPLPFLAPFATDAKHLARIGVPTYGFSPLKVGKGDGLLDLMHADDERVSLEALRFGFPALWDAVTRFCA
jgi:acetylornithine deacetylase/succinyl-diaminopimelate desuccinylase-like protein